MTDIGAGTIVTDNDTEDDFPRWFQPDPAGPDDEQRGERTPASPDAAMRVETAAQELHRALTLAGQSQLADHLRAIRLGWPLSPLALLNDVLNAWEEAGDPDDWGPDIIEDVEELTSAMAEAQRQLVAWYAKTPGQGELPLCAT